MALDSKCAFGPQRAPPSFQPLSGSLEQTLVEGVADKLRAAGKPQLLHDVRAVRLRRAHRDVELLRNLLIRVPKCKQAQNLALPVGKRILIGSPLLGRLGRDKSGA